MGFTFPVTRKNVVILNVILLIYSILHISTSIFLIYLGQEPDLLVLFKVFLNFILMFSSALLIVALVKRNLEIIIMSEVMHLATLIGFLIYTIIMALSFTQQSEYSVSFFVFVGHRLIIFALLLLAIIFILKYQATYIDLYDDDEWTDVSTDEFDEYDTFRRWSDFRSKKVAQSPVEYTTPGDTKSSGKNKLGGDGPTPSSTSVSNRAQPQLSCFIPYQHQPCPSGPVIYQPAYVCEPSLSRQSDMSSVPPQTTRTAAIYQPPILYQPPNIYPAITYPQGNISRPPAYMQPYQDMGNQGMNSSFNQQFINRNVPIQNLGFVPNQDTSFMSKIKIPEGAKYYPIQPAGSSDPMWGLQLPRTGNPIQGSSQLITNTSIGSDASCKPCT